MALRVILFDVDETLYPPGTGLPERVDRRITGFIGLRLGLGRQEADELRRRYWAEYGATVVGLHREHGVAYDDYYRAVTDFDFREHLRPDAAVAEAVRSLSQQRGLFSNGFRLYIDRILDALGLAGLFDPVFSIESFGYHAKPDPAAYRVALRELGVSPAECLLVDDAPRNLETARALGMRTALVGERAGACADQHLRSVVELPAALAGQ